MPFFKHPVISVLQKTEDSNDLDLAEDLRITPENSEDEEEQSSGKEKEIYVYMYMCMYIYILPTTLQILPLMLTCCDTTSSYIHPVITHT